MADDAKSLHDAFGPSSLLRRRLCPASAMEESGLPDETGPEAEYGTRLHALAARSVISGAVPADAAEEDAELVRRALDSVSEILSPGYGETCVEERMTLPHWSGDITFGTCDLMVLPKMLPDTVYIVDWKFGAEPVGEKDASWQLGAYAAMAMARTGRAKCLAKIVQPRAKGGLRNPWQVFENLPDLTAKIRRVKLSCQPEEHPVHVPGETQCRYCRAAAQGTCPAVSAAVNAAVAGGQQVERGERGLPLSDWDDATLSAFCAQIAVAEKAIQRAKDELKARLMSGRSIPGWRLDERRGQRRGDGALVWQAVQKHVTPGEYMAMCTPSLPKIEKLWADRESEETGCTKKAAAQAIREAMEESGAVAEGESTYTLRRCE